MRRGLAYLLTRPWGVAITALVVAYYAFQFGAGILIWGPALVVAAVAVVTWRRRSNTSASARQLMRWQRIDRRRLGTARASDVRRHASAWSLRWRAGQLRPSLAALSWYRRARLDPREVGLPLAKMGRRTLWASCEEATALIAGPRTGKSGKLASTIIDARGPVVATSTRVDLHRITAGMRGEHGVVAIFNPTGLGGLPSTVSFNPLAGCWDAAVAARRAGDLVPPAGDDDERKYWRGQAVRVLQSLLYAAAHDPSLTMRDVHAWVASPDAAASTVGKLLQHAGATSIGVEVVSFFNMNDRTRSSIAAGIMPALAWVHDEQAFQASSGARTLDVPSFLAGRNTLYMLGGSDGLVAPLITALTAHIAREARRVAEASPYGRLDPALLMCLDEAAIICPVPLPDWTADMGGRNVTIWLAAQSRAQLEARWGSEGARIILGNVATLMLLGGGNDPVELQMWEQLSGNREDQRATRNRYGRVESVAPTPTSVIGMQQLRQLPVGAAAIYRRGMPPLIGDLQMAWKRPDVREHERRVARAIRAAERAHHASRPVRVETEEGR